MPVIVDWYDEAQRIILAHFIENWTLAEYSEANAVVHRLSQQVGGRFDTVADLTEATYTPPVGTLWDWKQNTELRDSMFPNWGLTVFINPSRVYDAFFEEGFATSDVIRKHCRLARSIAEAIQIIQADRTNS